MFIPPLPLEDYTCVLKSMPPPVCVCIYCSKMKVTLKVLFFEELSDKTKYTTLVFYPDTVYLGFNIISPLDSS